MRATDVSGVYVFSERQDVALELLSAGRKLADEGGWCLGSIKIGPNAKAGAAEDIACGAERVLIASSPRLGRIEADLYAEALGAAMRRLNPEVVIVGATKSGTEIAARVAQRLGVGCAAECLALERAEGGGLVVEKRYYGGKFVARRLIQAKPAIVTVQPRKYEAPDRDPLREGIVEELSVDLPEAEKVVLGVEPRKRSGVEIGKAEIVVAIGRGLKRAEDLSIVRELADSLGAVVGASRPLTQELEWLPIDVQVGLSGTTVKPRLYIACGISGQIEHIVGMRGARIVVAINRDPNAPIMQEADYRIVGDLYEVIPALTRIFGQKGEVAPPARAPDASRSA